VNSSTEHVDWIGFMYAIQRFVNERISAEALAHVRLHMREQGASKDSESFALAEPEIRRAIELLVPGLMVDFFAENPSLVDSGAIARWIKEHS
jgi:hypothetical protein